MTFEDIHTQHLALTIENIFGKIPVMLWKHQPSPPQTYIFLRLFASFLMYYRDTYLRFFTTFSSCEEEDPQKVLKSYRLRGT